VKFGEAAIFVAGAIVTSPPTSQIQDYKFVNNSVTVYDIDRATLLGGAAGPLFLKSNVNLSGTCTKSQAARIISIRLREELGGTSIAEWKAARQLVFRTTVLALNTEPGMVCSMTHPDMARWRGRVPRLLLEAQQGLLHRHTGPHDPRTPCTIWSPARSPRTLPRRRFRTRTCKITESPAVVTGTPKLSDYGTFALDQMDVLPDASGNANIVGASEVAMAFILHRRACKLICGPSNCSSGGPGAVAPVFHARVQFPVAAAMAGGPDALEESPRVIVGTIHSVKGGEADVVFLFSGC